MNKFIVFEGPDGCGKTTILDLVEKHFLEKGISVVRTREPGGTDLGEEVRQIALSSKSNISPMTEAFLMSTSRSQLVDELILPSLESSHVFTDRFVPSSLVYQGVARDLGIEQIKELNDFALKGLRPHITLYFAIDYESSLKRKELRGSTDNIEDEAEEFHKDIHQGYEIVYNMYKDYYNIVKIDATKEIDDVFNQVMEVLNKGGL